MDEDNQDVDALKKEKLRAYEASVGGFELRAFEALEREFQEVLQELQQDRSLDHFRLEYEKLHRALKKSHESEKRLIKKCRELNTEILVNAGKVQNALRLNEEDQATILALKKEIEKAWKMVDASQEREEKSRDNIQQLKIEIANLSQIIEQGTGLSVGQDKEINDLMKEKEDACRERDQQLTCIVGLRKEITDLNEKIQGLEEQKLTMEHENTMLREQISAKKAETERETKKKERMEKEIRDLKLTLEAKQNEIKAKQQIVCDCQNEVEKLEHELREQKQITDKAQKELDSVNQKVAKLQADLEEQIHCNTQLLAENSEKQVQLKIKDDEIQAIKAEVGRVNKIKEATTIKIKGLEKMKVDAENQCEDLQNEIQRLEKEAELQKKLTDQEKKRQEELLRERDVLNKLRTQAENSIEKQTDLVKINEVAIRNLEMELQNYRDAALKQDKLINNLEKERQKYGAEASQAGVKYMQALDELKSKELAILDLQKKIAEGENRLKQQQNLYESVRSERNLLSKNLVDAQDELEEQRRKIKIITHQIEQLKEEINTKEAALIKEHAEFSKVEKERESLKQDLGKSHQQIKDAEAVIASHTTNIENMNRIISEADDERFRQRKELDIIKNERDILGAQLIRRNEELALLYEKIKIQQSALGKGQEQYRYRLNEIRLLKIKLTELKREHSVLEGSVHNITVLKREVHNLNRELLQERTKVKALSEELENPLNVHRWRQLEGTDPTAYEMILKIQTLQKRLILKTEQVLEKDLLIKEKEKLYAELRTILARQPGPEVMEQLAMYSKNLKEKTRQMQSMQSELQLYRGQVKSLKGDLEKLNVEYDNVKLKLYDKKRKEEQDRQKKREEESILSNLNPNQYQKAKVLGGGFIMN